MYVFSCRCRWEQHGALWKKGALIMRKFYYVFAAVVLLSSANIVGAQIARPIVAVAEPFQSTLANESAWSWRFGYTPTYYKLSLKKESIPVNSGDTGFLYGNTDVQVGSNIDWLSFTLGLQRSFQVDAWEGSGWSIMPKLGFDADLSLLSMRGRNNNGSNSMLYQFKQFDGDTRPASEGSFVYDKFAPGIFTPVPFVGVDFHRNAWMLSAELGFSYKELKREYGWNRFGKEQKYGGADEWCFSPRPAIGMSYKFDEDMSLGFFGSYEQYSPSFGDVSGAKFMLFLSRNL